MKKNEIQNVVKNKGKVTPKKNSSKKSTTRSKSTSTKKKQPKNVTIKKIEEKKIEEEVVEVKEEEKVEVVAPVKEEKLEEYEMEDIRVPFSVHLTRFFMKLGIVVGALILLLLLFLTLTEYRPDSKEEVAVQGEVHRSLAMDDGFTVMTWNVGYGALGDNADFFMDGGKMVQTADRNRVNKNLYSIRSKIDEISPSFLFLQEVDQNSKRANHVDEYSVFIHHLSNYQSSYALNFNVLYLPYPIPMIGNVKSGIASFSKFRMESSERIQLPVPFIWPVSTANLKRCVLVSRIPIDNTEKELVIMNVHLEAYDNGKGKEKQTKELLRLMRKETKKGNYVIVGGDFNQVFSSIDEEKIKVKDGLWEPGKIDIDAFGEGWQFYMDTNVPTCRSLDKPYVGEDKDKFQYYYIDGFIVSDNIHVESVETKDFGFVSSDHNPVLLKANFVTEQG